MCPFFSLNLYLASSSNLELHENQEMFVYLHLTLCINYMKGAGYQYEVVSEEEIYLSRIGGI